MMDVGVREVDFVTQFSKNWDALSDILGTMRLIRKEPGTTLKYRVATVQLLGQNGGGENPVTIKPIMRPGETSGENSDSTSEESVSLQDTNTIQNNTSYENSYKAIAERLQKYNPKYATFGRSNVPEGSVIPYSWGTVAEVPFGELTVDKYAKAVSLESINSYGYDIAVQETDNEFLNELQGMVLTDFYAFLRACGSADGGVTEEAEESGEKTKTWQQCLALARGRCLNEFMKMRRTVTDVIGFANIMDLYTYLGDAPITVQTAFGLSYVQNFMGYSTLLLLSDNEIPQGTVLATPANNIVLYYCDPSHSEFARAGLQYTVDGDTPLIGFHTQGNYNTAVSECFAIMGMTMICEFVDGVIEEKVVDSGGEE
ncbi:MAG: hypothetical protein LIP02_11755 [Bacteroidales bacterium]|nr:hypothetical protein [Bacteroidales bacterium]